MIMVIGGLELHVHEVQGGIGSCNEHDLHYRVVDGDKVSQEIEISSGVHDRK